MIEHDELHIPVSHRCVYLQLCVDSLYFLRQNSLVTRAADLRNYKVCLVFTTRRRHANGHEAREIGRSVYRHSLSDLKLFYSLWSKHDTTVFYPRRPEAREITTLTRDAGVHRRGLLRRDHLVVGHGVHLNHTNSQK